MRKSILILTCLLLSQVGFSQYVAEEDEKPERVENDSWFDAERFYVGGGLGLQFGDVTFIDLSPITGYWFTDKFTAGIGGRYQYISIRSLNFSTDVYGGNIFARHIIVEPIFAHVEVETLNGQWSHYDDRRFNITSLFAGGGYMSRIGEGGFLSLMILWNFNESIYSPYSNPVLRFNFGFSLF